LPFLACGKGSNGKNGKRLATKRRLVRWPKTANLAPEEQDAAKNLYV
jgi:hypothetical protein